MLKNVLQAKAQLHKKWGLKLDPPFRGVPSTDINEHMQIFVSRETEMEKTILTLDEGENVLIRGMTGIGKTAFIMAALHQLEQHASTINKKVLPIHIRQFVGGTRDDFYKIILYSLGKRLAPTNKRARDIIFSLTGEQITKSKSNSLSTGIEVQIPQIFTAKVGGEIGDSESKILSLDYPQHFVDELLDIAGKKYTRVVFAVDDLERATNQSNIKLMLENTLDLIRDKRCSFILTGRTLTVLEDVYASGLDIFNETIPLKPLSPEELRLIAIRTLNFVRHHPDIGSTLPFTEDVVNSLASKSFGIPRQFVLLCGKILKLAIQNQAEELNLEVFHKCFEQLQDEVAGTDVPPDIRRVLYLGLQKGGFSISKDADLDQVFDVLGVTTLRQFVDFADNLVQQDLLQRFTDNRGEILYRLAPSVEKLAQSGNI